MNHRQANGREQRAVEQERAQNLDPSARADAARRKAARHAHQVAQYQARAKGTAAAAA
jgi:hypothetical protein